MLEMMVEPKVSPQPAEISPEPEAIILEEAVKVVREKKMGLSVDSIPLRWRSII